MSLIDGMRAWLGGIGRGSAEARMNEEIGFHIDMEAEKNVRAGMDPAEARRRALLAFGGAETVREEVRSGRALSWIDDAVRDAREAFRSLRREPAWASTAVLTIALGIGANTSIFGVVDVLFLRAPAGVADARDVVRLYIARDEGMVQTGEYGGAGSYVDYSLIRAGVPGFRETAAFMHAQDLDLDRGAEASRVVGSVVTQTYLPLLGVVPAAGRLFTAEEDSAEGTHPVAVVSSGFAARRFGSVDAAVGETLLLNGQQVRVIGVTERGFVGIESEPVDVWVPMALASVLGLAPVPGWRPMEGMVVVNVIGRLAPGAEADGVAAVAQTILRNAASAYPDIDPTPTVLTGTLVAAGAPGPSRAADLSKWLFVVATLLLLIACANVANLLLSRQAARRRETATRLALGARRSRVVRQHLTESLLIAFTGGVIGVAIALLASRLVTLFPVPVAATEMGARPLLFALGLVVLTAFVSGIVPALQAGRADIIGTMKERHGLGRSGRPLQRTLIGLQGALAIVLLVGTGLFVRSLREVHAIDSGLRYDELLTVSADLATAGLSDAEREAFYRNARERVLGIPGVASATMTHFAPFARTGYGAPVDLPGSDTLAFESGPMLNWVSAGYFDAVGTRIIRGREFTDSDRTGEITAIVNASFADQVPSGTEVLGACLLTIDAPDECTRVVGVVANQRRRFLDEAVPPTLFLSRDRFPAPIDWGGPTLVIRTRGRPDGLAGVVRSALQDLDPRLPYVSVEPLSARIRADVLPYRLGATLFTVFGLLALVIAGLGVYGVLGHFVAERRPDIGIRRSLGATDGHVLRFVVREGMTPIAIGALLGLALALLGSRLVESLLYGVDARDPLVFAAAALFLIGIGVVACYLPARRATRADPMPALRAQ